MRVAAGRDDITRDIGRPTCDVLIVGMTIATHPVAGCTVVFVGEEGENDTASEGDELNDTSEVN